MSQSVLKVSTVSPLSGFAEVLQINSVVAALASLQSGTAAPTAYSTVSGSTALVEGQLWLNTGPSVHVVYKYDGASFQVFANPAPDAGYLQANFGVL